MLYNKNWDAKTVTSDPFSLENLIAWLEKQPADRVYCSTAAGICLIAQWVGSIDPCWKQGPGHSFMYIVHGKNRDFRQFDGVVFGGDSENTFGAALERARTALSAR